MEFIRINTPGQVDEVYTILAAAGAYMAETFGLTHWATPYSRERIAEDAVKKQVYLARAEGVNVATFTLTDQTSQAFRDLPNAGAVYLSKFAVRPDTVRSGVGTACIRHMEELCRQWGKTSLRFDVYHKSEHALRFYEKMGYREVLVPSPISYLICMEKHL